MRVKNLFKKKSKAVKKLFFNDIKTENENNLAEDVAEEDNNSLKFQDENDNVATNYNNNSLTIDVKEEKQQQATLYDESNKNVINSVESHRLPTINIINENDNDVTIAQNDYSNNDLLKYKYFNTDLYAHNNVYGSVNFTTVEYSNGLIRKPSNYPDTQLSTIHEYLIEDVPGSSEKEVFEIVERCVTMEIHTVEETEDIETEYRDVMNITNERESIYIDDEEILGSLGNLLSVDKPDFCGSMYSILSVEETEEQMTDEAQRNSIFFLIGDNDVQKSQRDSVFLMIDDKEEQWPIDNSFDDFVVIDSNQKKSFNSELVVNIRQR